MADLVESFKSPKGRMRIRPGLPDATRAGRPNRRVRAWAFEPKPGSTLAKMEAAYLGAQAAVDQVLDRRDAAAKSGQFTEQGIAVGTQQFALSKAVPAFKRGRDLIVAAKQELEQKRAKIKVKELDNSDPWRVQLRARALDDFRAVSQEQKDKLTRNPDKLDPIMREALIYSPVALTGMSEMHRAQLIGGELATEHGELIAETDELEKAIDALSSVVETGRDEVRLETGLDRGTFEERAAEVEKKVNAPWLKKFVENGQEVIRKIELDGDRGTGSVPLATAEEIDGGVFAENLDAYKKLTGYAA